MVLAAESAKDFQPSESIRLMGMKSPRVADLRITEHLSGEWHRRINIVLSDHHRSGF